MTIQLIRPSDVRLTPGGPGIEGRPGVWYQTTDERPSRTFWWDGEKMVPLLTAGETNAVRGASAAGGVPTKADVSAAVASLIGTEHATDKITTLSEAAHFLRQAAMGATWAEIQACHTLGSRKLWVRQQLAMSLSKSFRQRMFDAPISATDLAGTSYVSAVNYTVNTGFGIHSEPAILRLRCLWALAKFFPVGLPGGGLASYGNYEGPIWLDRLNAHVFGNFRDLLESVSYSTPMASMLTFNANEKAAPDGSTQPDENYAREIMQLFTIGLWELNPDGTQRLDADGQPIQTYGNDDIRQLARAFTGLCRPDLASNLYTDPNPSVGTISNMRTRFGISNNLPRAQMLFDNPDLRQKHFHYLYEWGAKRALGGRIDVPEGTDPVTNLAIVHDALFNHPNTPPFVARRFIQMLVKSNPTPAYVARVAAKFIDNGFGVRGDMKALWTAILCDPEASYDGAIDEHGGRVRDGFECWIHWLRVLHRENNSGFLSWAQNARTEHMNDFGNADFLSSPSIFGFHDANHTEGSLAEWGLEAPEIGQWSDVLLVRSVNRLRNRTVSSEPRDTPANSTYLPSGGYASYLPVTGTAAELAERLNLLLCGGRMSPGLRASIVSVTDGMATGTDTQQQDRIAVALQLVIVSPDFRVQL